MTTITWKAEQLERNTSDGLVTTVFRGANAIDGVVKNDQAQIDKYIADCRAVKAKYPK